jgi:catechol 2,3-dioxygenase-like lactoylglutathione lyase family enzyme
MSNAFTFSVPPGRMPAVRKMHHVAYRCRDSEETRRFYEDLLGLKMSIFLDIPYYATPGDRPPFAHLFLEMGDGSYIAFFDLGDNKAAAPDPDTPQWATHLALEMGSMDDLLAAKARLEGAGVPVVGPKDHDFVKSIYFTDPNGLVLEFTCRVKDRAYLDKLAGDAHGILDKWQARA